MLFDNLKVGKGWVSLISPEAGVSTDQYDADNELISQTDPDGNTTQSFYNLAGQVNRTISPNGGVTIDKSDAETSWSAKPIPTATSRSTFSTPTATRCKRSTRAANRRIMATTVTAVDLDARP